MGDRSSDGNHEEEISYKRQVDLFNPEDFSDESVTIVGVGNIGSQAGLALARLGIRNFTLIDHDHVEEHNLPSQSFDLSHLGVAKVTAMKKQIMSVNLDAYVTELETMFDSHKVQDQILIIAVDSMGVRREIYEQIKLSGDIPKLIIDARVGGPQLEVYTCETMEEWSTKFYDNPSDDPCGARYICYISMVVGAFIANQVKRYLRDENYNKRIMCDLNTYQLFAFKE